jgi:hypothetical protein
MNEDTKIKLVVAGGAFVIAAAGAGIARRIQKRRLKKPLDGTTKIERIYVIKTPVKKAR